jgi:hypothetical protein
MRKNQEAMRCLFVYSPAVLTAAVVEALFQTKWTGNPGSNKRAQETKVCGFWADLLIDMEGLYNFCLFSTLCANVILLGRLKRKF